MDQESLEKVIRDNLSLEVVATIIAFLQPAAFYRPSSRQSRKKSPLDDEDAEDPAAAASEPEKPLHGSPAAAPNALCLTHQVEPMAAQAARG